MSGQRPARSTCRSCGEPIIWVRTVNGVRAPVDAVPHDGGNLVLSGGREPVATVVSRTGRPPGTPLYRSHFASCRQASQHRKPVARPSVPPAMPQEGLFRPPELDDDAAVDAYHDHLADIDAWKES